MPKIDFDFWNPANGHVSTVLGQGNDGSFIDSVEPVHQAGQAVLWEDSHIIDSSLHLEHVPGHTPGSSVFKRHSGSDRVVFAGDPEVQRAALEAPGSRSMTVSRLT